MGNTRKNGSPKAHVFIQTPSLLEPQAGQALWTNLWPGAEFLLNQVIIRLSPLSLVLGESENRGISSLSWTGPSVRTARCYIQEKPQTSLTITGREQAHPCG